MQYIMVQNKGEIPVDGIRLLGQSSKTDDQIGIFGTGLKESIALCFRLGISMTICSGSKVIKFVSHETDFRGEICHEIGYEIEGTYHPMNITTNFGQQDWNTEWQILREIYCNAHDEGGLHHMVTGDIDPKEGCTKVYLEATYDLLEEWQKIKSKLLFLSNKTPLHAFKDYRLYQGEGRIYKKGVYVTSVKGLAYDYELPNLKLTESRTASHSSVRSSIVELINHTSWDIQLEYINNYIEKGNEAREFIMLLESWSSHNIGLKYSEEFPSHRWVYPTVDAIQKAKALNYYPVKVSNEAHLKRLKDFGFNLLESGGVTLIKEVQNPYANVKTYLADVDHSIIQDDVLLIRDIKNLKVNTFRYLLTKHPFALSKACMPFMDEILGQFK